MNRKKLLAAVGVVGLAIAVLPAATNAAAEVESPAKPLSAAVKLTQVGTAMSPTAATTGPTGTLWIAERADTTATVKVLTDEGLSEPVVSVETSADSDGLAGMAFDPDFSHFYLSYTNIDGHNVVDEFDVSYGQVQVDSRRQILIVEQQEPAHHSGHLNFGADGMLYIALGDGGHDEEGDPYDNAQNLGVLQGKMLRIDVVGGDPYAIPADNPFVNDATARGEIWAYGLRSPWQFSFDADNGDMWIGDVGAATIEEVDHTPGDAAGVNYGWPYMEGTRLNRGEEPANHHPPVYEYEHGSGGGACSVTGGFVYRGAAIPELQNHFVFADYCTGAIQAVNGATNEVVDLGLTAGFVTTFGQTADKEIYVFDMGPFGDPAPDAIYRLDPA